MNCEKCGAQINAGDKFCSACGAEQQTVNSGSGTYCTNCGVEIFASDTFCPGCGRRTKTSETVVGPSVYQQNSTKQKNTTIIILIIILALLIAFAAVLGAYALWGNNSSETENETDIIQTTETVTDKQAPMVPVFEWIAASSTRGYDKDNTTGEIIHYYPEYAIDGDMRTAWTPDRNIESMPTITLNAHTDQYVTGIRMTNGYCKSEKTYTRNRRITRVRVSYRGGEKEATFGIDNYRAMLSVKFDEPVNTNYISITVLDTYYGDWKDIAISEIEVF